MIKELGAFIASKGGLTVGTTLHVGWRPQDAADACDVLQEYGGSPIFDIPEQWDAQVQVVSRAKSYHAARTRAYAIYDAICKPTVWRISALTSGGQAYLAVIEANQRPQYLGEDEKLRPEFVVNYTLHMEKVV